MDFIGYGRQSISEEDIEAVVQVLRGKPLPAVRPSVLLSVHLCPNWCTIRHRRE